MKSVTCSESMPSPGSLPDGYDAATSALLLPTSSSLFCSATLGLLTSLLTLQLFKETKGVNSLLCQSPPLLLQSSLSLPALLQTHGHTLRLTHCFLLGGEQTANTIRCPSVHFSFSFTVSSSLSSACFWRDN
ncbi:hypothetical protein EYF80_044326 [Liparis tanakae]|uniref:Uncharacterized protein n=1 Tax=Liparis tanakae TaxID=230148 RepID=A0A4Z2FW59_9TELE|nr:hypothetical protein EYF80_044326 [Liparis tanakae]